MTAQPPDITQARCLLFMAHHQAGSIELPSNGRLIAFVAGQPPRVLPITDPGNYEVDAQLLASGSWPVMVAVVPKRHAAAFALMDAAKTDDILKRACAKALHVAQKAGRA